MSKRKEPITGGQIATFIFLALLLGGIGSILFPVGTIIGVVIAWFGAAYGAHENRNIDAVIDAAKRERDDPH